LISILSGFCLITATGTGFTAGGGGVGFFTGSGEGERGFGGEGERGFGGLRDIGCLGLLSIGFFTTSGGSST